MHGIDCAKTPGALGVLMYVKGVMIPQRPRQIVRMERRKAVVDSHIQAIYTYSLTSAFPKFSHETEQTPHQQPLIPLHHLPAPQQHARGQHPHPLPFLAAPAHPPKHTVHPFPRLEQFLRVLFREASPVVVAIVDVEQGEEGEEEGFEHGGVGGGAGAEGEEQGPELRGHLGQGEGGGAGGVEGEGEGFEEVGEEEGGGVGGGFAAGDGQVVSFDLGFLLEGGGCVDTMS